MAFNSILATDIEAGDPVSQELWDLVRTDLDDLNTRVVSIEGSLQNFQPMSFQLEGMHWRSSSDAGLIYMRVGINITLTSASLYIQEGGLSGTFTVDVQKSSAGGGAFSTIFSVKPTILTGGTDHEVVTGSLATTVLVAGDILRVDVDSFAVGLPSAQLYLGFIST